MKRYLSLLFFTILLTSCTVERVNLSPLSSNFAGYTSTNDIIKDTSKSVEIISYASELTNLVSAFPVFNNTKVDAEVYKLKQNITDYIYAVKKDSAVEKSNAYKDFTDSYKNIQKLKSDLSSEELELLNRYLVKIKTNISLIDSINISEAK